MAVQQNKKSHSRKGMRRSHDSIAVPNVIYCACGAPKLPHTVCPECGKYGVGDKSRQVVIKKEKKKQQENSDEAEN